MNLIKFQIDARHLKKFIFQSFHFKCFPSFTSQAMVDHRDVKLQAVEERYTDEDFLSVSQIKVCRTHWGKTIIIISDNLFPKKFTKSDHVPYKIIKINSLQTICPKCVIIKMILEFILQVMSKSELRNLLGVPEETVFSEVPKPKPNSPSSPKDLIASPCRASGNRVSMDKYVLNLTEIHMLYHKFSQENSFCAVIPY